MLFITHDLALVGEIADQVIVMRHGQIREQGRVKDVLERPQDVYTKALLHCRPQLSKRPMRLPMISDFMQQKGDDYIETHTIDVESLQQRIRQTGVPSGQRREFPTGKRQDFGLGGWVWFGENDHRIIADALTGGNGG